MRNFSWFFNNLAKRSVINDLETVRFILQIEALFIRMDDEEIIIRALAVLSELLDEPSGCWMGEVMSLNICDRILHLL